MRLRGAFAVPEGFVAFGPERGLVAGVDDRASVDPNGLARMLTAPAVEIAADVADAAGFGLWLALHDPAYFHLSDDRPEPILAESACFLLTGEGYRFTIGLLDGDRCCLLLHPAETGDGEGVRIRCYGEDLTFAGGLGERCRGHLDGWQAAGRPTFETVRLRVYPIGTPPSPPSSTLIEKRWHTFAIDWDEA